jgi:predicted nucleic acid-binding protein
VKFWDSSAVVALLVGEAGQKFAQREFEQDPAMVVWWGTRVECVSALVRRERDRSTDPASSRTALAQLGKLGEQWHEVLPTTVLRNTAERILRVHALRAADALQLAAAITAAVDDPASLEFVSLDERLKDAAAREGFPVL